MSPGKCVLSRHEKARRGSIVCWLGAHLSHFSEEQLDILARCPVDFTSPGDDVLSPGDITIRPNQRWDYSEVGSAPDAMSCLRTLWIKTENVLEQENCCKVLLVMSLASAMLSAVCAVLYQRTEATFWALLMLIFLILTSWSFIFRRKRKQIDSILNDLNLNHEPLLPVPS